MNRNKLVQHLIAKERRVGDTPGRKQLAGFAVCEKLRQPLRTFIGVAGFYALLLRAKALTKGAFPVLDEVTIKPDGAFLFPAEFETRHPVAEVTRSGEALAGQLVELLITFIGEALTLRLLQDIWPRAASTNSKTERKQP